MTHTPERLHTMPPFPDGSPRGAYDQRGHWVLPAPECIGSECVYDRHAFQARVIAAFNACEGIPVAALEASVVKEAWGILEEMVQNMAIPGTGYCDWCNMAGHLAMCPIESAQRVLAKTTGAQS